MILRSTQFQNLMVKHAKEILHFLVNHGISFNILCDIQRAHFDPPLPPEIDESLDDLTLFVLAGYTFESIELGINAISFEAGFGSTNIGALVSIEYEGVVQIILQDPKLMHEISLFINVTNPLLYGAMGERDIKEDLERSREMLLSNPENAKLFKKD